MTSLLLLINCLVAVNLPDPASVAVPLAETGNGLLVTDGRRQGLHLISYHGELETISVSPGAGGNVLLTESGILFKECPGGSLQRVLHVSWSGDRKVLYEEEHFSGPFPSENGSFLVAERDRVCEVDLHGEVIGQWPVEGYPASVLLRDGQLIYTMESGGLSFTGHHQDRLFTELTPGPDGMLLAEMSPCGFIVIDEGNRVLRQILTGQTPYWTADGRVLYTEADLSGLMPVSGRIMELDPVDGERRLLRSGDFMSNPVSFGDRELTWTETDGSLAGFDLELPDLGERVSPAEDPAAHFDVVYMHQRWDTPDWFNGSWSCGPTSCLMATQYYLMLTPDSIWASYPSPGHWSQWGNYVPVEYTFLGYTYDELGESPGGVYVPGAHGFICPGGGAVWNLMVEFLDRHGIYSAWAGTSWSTLTGELESDYPVVCSSSVLGYGHIILFNGYYDDHTVVVNDPYGDANEPGWGNYYNGKDVLYDWPGYNNGHVQIGVSQLFFARSCVPAEPDTLVDDCSRGFYKYGDCCYWHLNGSGYQGESWWTYSTGAPPDTCIAEWHPVLPAQGDYEVLVHIPPDHSTATGIYHIETLAGSQEVLLDQGLYSDEWASLGIFGLDQDATLRLGDYTGTGGEQISFDAARFSPAGTGIPGEPSPENMTVPEIWPNPCGGQLSIGPVQSREVVTVEIFDTSGRLQLAYSAESSSGTAVADLSSLPGGVYIVRVSNPGGPVSSRLLTICP